MAFSPPVAVFDACVLHPFHLRNLLAQVFADRLVEARWSGEIRDEWIRSPLEAEPRLARALGSQTRCYGSGARPNTGDLMRGRLDNGTQKLSIA